MVRAIRLSIEAVDPRLEARGAHAGREPHARVLHGDAAARVRRASLTGALLGFARGARRIRRHDHVRLEHPGRDATLPLAIYSATAGAGRRRRRRCASSILSVAPLARGARALRVARAPRPGGARACLTSTSQLARGIVRARRALRSATRRSWRSSGAPARARRRWSKRSPGWRARTRAASSSTGARSSTARAGIDLPPEARRVGYVFQEGAALPAHVACARNLAYGESRSRRRGALRRSRSRRRPARARGADGAASRDALGRREAARGHRPRVAARARACC